jgi:integrase
VTLGPLPIREARRKVKRLAGLAELAFDRLRKRKMSGARSDDSDDPEWDPVVLAVMRAMEFVGRSNEPDREVACAAADAALDGVLRIAIDRRSASSDLVDHHGDLLEEHFIRVMTDAATGRAHLGLPPVPQPAGPQTETKGLLEKIAADQAVMRSEIVNLTKERANVGALFSEASAAYCEDLSNANGADDKELTYLRHRTKVFLKLIGDKPVTAYTAKDLKHFVQEISYLPPNISKQENYNIDNVLDYISEGKKLKTPRMSQSTLFNNYLGKVKTILKAGCEEIGATFALQDLKIRIPKGVPPPKNKLMLDYPALEKLFRAGIRSGNFINAILPLLGFVTGRRLGLLAFLRREDLISYSGVRMIASRPLAQVDGVWTTVPFKTAESLNYFVLHEIFDRIGLIDFWKSLGPGYVFEELHEGRINDPADAVQKRMGRLFDSADVDRKIFRTFRGLRHSKINEDRLLKIDQRVTRLQVGHYSTHTTNMG